MSNQDNGGPAFPSGEQYSTIDLVGNVTRQSKGALHNGMTMRDHFAAMAMPAVIQLAHQSDGIRTVDDSPVTEALIAKQAYCFADAMLEARKS